jgi:hypothetical protein
MPDSQTAPLDDIRKTASPFPFLASAFEHLAQSQRRNAEVATAVAKLTTGSVQTAWQKQWIYFNQLVSDAHDGHRDLWSLGPDEVMAKRAAVAKATVEKAVAGAREITDLLLKSSNEASDLLTKRIIESLTELPGKA